MTPFIEYLEEAYGPIVSLLRDESNRQKLMKLGVSKNSKLVRISMPDAIDNEEDIILFANIFPTGEEEGKGGMGNIALRKDLKKTKAREALAKKDNVPSTWIGYKRGDEYEVWRPKEAGKDKPCSKLSCLFDSDFAYKVTNPRKEDLLRKFRQENPGRKEWIEGGRKEAIGNLTYKMYKSKLIRLLDATLGKVNKDTLDLFTKNYTTPIANGIDKGRFDYWSDGPFDNNGVINNILTKLTEIDKKKDTIDKKTLETFINKIEKGVK